MAAGHSGDTLESETPKCQAEDAQVRVHATPLPRKKKPVRAGATHSHSGDPVPVIMAVSVKTLGKKTRLPHIGQETSR